MLPVESVCRNILFLGFQEIPLHTSFISQINIHPVPLSATLGARTHLLSAPTGGCGTNGDMLETKKKPSGVLLEARICKVSLVRNPEETLRSLCNNTHLVKLYLDALDGFGGFVISSAAQNCVGPWTSNVTVWIPGSLAGQGQSAAWNLTCGSIVVRKLTEIDLDILGLQSLQWIMK